MRITLKTINAEMARLGFTARLAKGDRYFYFHFGEAADWIDRTVDTATVNSRTLNEWIGEFRRLHTLNAQIMGKASPKTTGRKRSGTGR
jgi:hypothetical protein